MRRIAYKVDTFIVLLLALFFLLGMAIGQKKGIALVQDEYISKYLQIQSWK